MSMGNNETLDNPMLEPPSSGALHINDTEIRLRRLEELIFSAQTVDQKTTAKVEAKPVADTVQVDNNKKLVAKFDALSDKFDTKFDALDDKFDALSDKFDALSDKFDAKFDAINDKYNTINTKVEVLGAKFEILDSKLNFFLLFIGLVTLIFMGIAVPAHYSLSTRIDTKMDALVKTVSDMRVDIAKLQVSVGQLLISPGLPPVAVQQKSPAPAETKGEAIPDQNSQ